MENSKFTSMSIVCVNGRFKTIPNNMNLFYLFIARFYRFIHGLVRVFKFIFSPPENNEFKHKSIDAYLDGEMYIIGIKTKLKITTFIGCECGNVYYARLFSKHHNMFSSDILNHLNFFQVSKALNYHNKYEKQITSKLNIHSSVGAQIPRSVIRNEPSEWIVGNWVWFLEYFKDVEPNNKNI